MYQWLTRAQAAYGKRNRIVHSGWYVDATEPGELKYGFMRWTARKKAFEVSHEPADPNLLHSIARELERVGLDGVTLMVAVREEVGELDV